MFDAYGSQCRYRIVCNELTAVLLLLCEGSRSVDDVTLRAGQCPAGDGNGDAGQQRRRDAPNWTHSRGLQLFWVE